jgi:hypothetical protein
MISQKYELNDSHHSSSIETSCLYAACLSVHDDYTFSCYRQKQCASENILPYIIDTTAMPVYRYVITKM